MSYRTREILGEDVVTHCMAKEAFDQSLGYATFLRNLRERRGAVKRYAIGQLEFVDSVKRDSVVTLPRKRIQLENPNKRFSDVEDWGGAHGPHDFSQSCHRPKSQLFQRVGRVDQSIASF